jgi:hypothetical protein
MKAQLAIVILFSLMAASCGSRMEALSAAGQDRRAGAADDFEGWQEWQQILANPGQPYVDYDPHSITVNYLPNAEFGQMGNFAPPPGHRAADKPNASLRRDTRYEAITDNISGRFGIAIEQQVYADGLLMASFRMPDWMEAEYVIGNIRSEYAAQVLDVTYSRLMQACFSPNDKYYTKSSSMSGGQWGLLRIAVPEAWKLSLGDPGQLVGVVDSGCLLSHEDIGEAIIDPRSSYPAAACDLLDADNDITDTDGHGTAICAVLAAGTNNIHGLAAVLPAGRVLPLRVASGEIGSQANIVAGCMLAADLGCRIVNLSWAASSGSRQLSQMATALENRGVLLMAAAGNTGSTAPRYPAAYSSVCGISASTPADSLAPDASYGDWTELSAPGTGFTVPGIAKPNSYLADTSGSSLACALASGAAALLLAHDPQLAPLELRQLLIASATPLLGEGAPRINLAAALTQHNFPKISLTGPTSLVQSEFLQLQPQIEGSPLRLDLWIDGQYMMSRLEAPWQLTADLRGLPDGVHVLELRAIAADQQNYSSAGYAFVTSVQSLQMPLSLGFETPGSLLSLDVSKHDPALLAELSQLAGFPLLPAYAVDDGLRWKQSSANVLSGQYSLAASWNGQPAGMAGLHALISPNVGLSGYQSPTLSVSSRWLLAQAQGALLISVDNGQSWELAVPQPGSSSQFSGQQEEWRTLQYDLSAWSGQQLRLCFLLQRSALDATAEQGWWLDELGIATEFQTSLPVIDEVLISDSLMGMVPGRDSLELSLSGAVNVQSVRYWLDCEPLGTEGGADIVVNAILGAGLPASIKLAGLPGRNYDAVLRVDYFDAKGSYGPRFNLPIRIFNQPGDADGNGQVNELDLAAYSGKLGLRREEAGYHPFLDSNLDGLITELDAAAVAYNFAAAK